jgi:hypothetical protein
MSIDVGTTIFGSGSTSATTSLLVQNSSGNAALEITDDRTTTISGTRTNLSTGKVFVGTLSLTAGGTQDTGNGIYSTGGDGTVVIATSVGAGNTSGGVQISTWNSGNSSLTNVNKSLLSIINSGFSDGNIDNLSGNTVLLRPTYNFLGGRTGITVRGIYYNPTLTSLVNTTHTAIETVTGNVLLGTTSGNVGIGTSNPGSKLTVDGNISVINNNSIIGYVASNQGMYLTGGAGEFRFINGGGGGWYYTWYQNGGEGMRLSTANNLLIGTTTDSGFKLDVNGTLRVVDKVRFQNEVAFYSTDGNAKFVIPAAAGYATQINYGSWGSASIKFIDVQTGGLLLGNTTSTVSLNAMLDLQSDSRGMYFNRGTIATMPNLVVGGGTPTYSIISPGSGYTDGTYTNVTATGNYFGSKQVVVTVTGGVVTNIGLWSYGSKVQVGEVFTVAPGALGAGGSGFSFTVTSMFNGNPGFTFYNTTTNSLTYWNGTNYAVPVVSLLDRVNIGSSSPADRSAILQVTSNTQGFLPPRMTNAQRLAISSPAVALMVYQTDMIEGLYIYKSTGWTFII